MKTRNRKLYILSETGYNKVISVLSKNQDITSRNWASWIEKQAHKIGETLDDGTIRKILQYKGVERSRIELTFKVLKLEYEQDQDSILFSQPASSKIVSPIAYQNLPSRDYTTFIGRETEIEKLLKLLSQENIYRISVESIGGMGKTTLVLEAAYRCLEARNNRNNKENLPQFDAVIFTSAKQQRLQSKGLAKCWKQETTQKDIVREIADTIQTPEINHILDSQEQLKQLQNKLRYLSTLLIIDNLETIEDQENITSFIYELPPTVKVVITSRQQTLLDDVIKLEPLAKKEGLYFIQNKAKIHGLEISLASQELIYHTTGGMPGAMIYAIGQLRAFHDLEVVLSRLIYPQTDVNKFWFEGSLQGIRKQPAYYLLMALAMFSQPALESAIVQVALPEADKFTISEGFTQLQQLLLINKSINDQINHQETRYVISLPLTRGYVFAELEVNIHFEKKARERWLNWYLE